MGRMTSYTIPCFDRFTQFLLFLVVGDQFLLFYSVCMALPADLNGGSFQELLLSRGVWIVAVKASLLIENGPMHPFFLENTIDHILVTLLAQFRPLFLCL